MCVCVLSCVCVCVCVCVDHAEGMGHDVGGLSLSVYNIGPVGQNIMHCLSLIYIITVGEVLQDLEGFEDQRNIIQE